MNVIFEDPEVYESRLKLLYVVELLGDDVR